MIIEIEEIKAISGFLKIRLSNGNHVCLRRNSPLSSSVYQGLQMDMVDFYHQLYREQYPQAMDSAGRILSARDYSVREMEQKLSRLHYEPEIVNRVIEKLKAENLLDDTSFATRWTAARIQRYGTARIRRELRLKGVSEEIIQSALSAVDEDQQLEQALRWIAKSMKNAANPPTLQDRRRILNMLLRKGYSLSLAQKAWHLWQEE